MKRVRYYARVFLALARCSLMTQLEYRINYLSGLLIEIAYALVKLIYVVMVYRTGCHIGLLTPDHIAKFVGSYALLTGIYMYFYRGYTAIPDYVKTGDLDMLLVKPLSLRFLVTFRQLDYAMPLPNAAVGIALIAYGWQKTGLPVTAGSIAGFVGFILLGTATTLLFFLIPHILAFWFVGVKSVVGLSADLWDFGNMPGRLYGRVIDGLGTFVFPIFLVTNYPIWFIMGRLTAPMLVWALLAPVLAFFLSQYLWKLALKRYTSASS